MAVAGATEADLGTASQSVTLGYGALVDKAVAKRAFNRQVFDVAVGYISSNKHQFGPASVPLSCISAAWPETAEVQAENHQIALCL